MKTNKIKVSIICITYNQEKFIKQTLDGFLMQKTDFPFEIIIHDDASTDNTVAIIKDYVKRQPKLFRPIYEKSNKFSKKNYSFIENMFRSAKGEFIAICEGDDFWTDPRKIQIQADFLDKNKRHSICFHPVKVVFENNEDDPYIYPTNKLKNNFTTDELLKNNFIQTNSVMYRKQSYRALRTDQLPIDWYLHLYHARTGKIGFIDKVMAVYRRHPGGVWWESHNDSALFWKNNWESEIKFYEKIIPLYNGDKNRIESIKTSIANKFSTIAEMDDKNNTQILERAVSRFPKYAAISLSMLRKENLELKMSLNKSIEDIKLLKLKNENMINSRSWKITKPLRSISQRTRANKQ